MLTLQLPDGSTRQVPAGTPAADVVRSIGERLARDAVAVEVNGEVQDLVTPLRTGGGVPGASQPGARGPPPRPPPAPPALWARGRARCPGAEEGVGGGRAGGGYFHIAW